MNFELLRLLAVAGLTLQFIAQPAAAAELAKITVGVMPIVDVSPVYIGVKQGFFKDQGLDVTIESGSGGAALIPSVQSKSMQFAFSNVVSIMIARDKGLDLKIVANATSTTGNKTSDSAGVVVRPDSPIRDAKGLTGQRVSSNTLGNIADTATRAAVDKAGGASSTIKFIELALPSALPALENKQVDAVYLVEPFLSAALAKGNRVVSYIYAELDPRLDVAVYFTTGDYARSNPELVKKFQAAMNKSLQYAQEHPADVRAIVASYTKIPVEALAKVVLPHWRTDISKDSLRIIGAAAYKYGAVSAEPKLDELAP
jgi:NitT/TauT family transport system substrate-binding protein